MAAKYTLKFYKGRRLIAEQAFDPEVYQELREMRGRRRHRRDRRPSQGRTQSARTGLRQLRRRAVCVVPRTC